MKTLDKAKVGKIYKIVGFAGEPDAILRRFFELGFAVGQNIKIVSTSIAKKVFLLEFRGYIVSVRASLLDRVQVKE